MLTGRPPFTGEDVTSVMFQIMNLVPPPPSSVNTQVPEMLDFIVAKAIAKSLDDRYFSADDMAKDLREVAKHLDTTVHALTATRPIVAPKLDTTAAQALVQSLPAARRADSVSVSPDASPAPALGLSRAFDSLDATMKLAIKTGMAEELESFTGKHAPLIETGSPSEARALVGAMRKKAWDRKDRIVFAASVAGATVVGALIVFV